MDRRIIATLKPKKYPSLGFNVAKSFVSVPPPLLSHARGKKTHFSAPRRSNAIMMTRLPRIIVIVSLQEPPPSIIPLE
jgi:hypothetical protein